jgi:chaperone required for assembly of F1-ATPase
MRDELSKPDLISGLTPAPGEGLDPAELARRDLVKHLPKRFYERAEAAREGDGWELRLDGKPARTPKRLALRSRRRGVMEEVAAEWSAQGERIDHSTMPMTRLLNVALDAVPDQRAEVAADAAKFAASDLLFYRAEEPQSLVEAETAAWDTVLAWARETYGARFHLAAGVTFVTQPLESVAAIARALDEIEDAETLAALHAMTTLTGSVLLAFAVYKGRLSAEEAWAAAHVGEDHQMKVWGQDAEALARRAARWSEMRAAAMMCRFEAS